MAAILTGGNRNDVTQLMPLIEQFRRCRPVVVDRGDDRTRCSPTAYDHDKYREQVQATGITPVIARRGVTHGSALGK